MLTHEMRYKLMRVLEAKPDMSQREIARELVVSLGRVNYFSQALIGKGLLKATALVNGIKNSIYTNLLTPHGMEQKANLAARFLKAKIQECEALRREIDQVQRDAEGR
jgi:EPS-associated MarR family transcriptional regulator